MNNKITKPEHTPNINLRSQAWWQKRADEFITAARAPNRDVPDEIGKTSGHHSVKRFNVYRNNIATSLRAAMSATYPVVEMLVGDDFFAAMAKTFVAEHTPASPVLSEYGANFANFLDNFEPARQIPYLADVARVEWAYNESFHAGDATPLAIDALSQLDSTALDAARFVLHPSLRLIRSDWAVLSIWQAHQHDDPAEQIARMNGVNQAEVGYVVRPKHQVTVTRVPSGAVDLLEALSVGQTLPEAAENLSGTDQAELGAMLATVFDSGAVVGLETSLKR